VRPKLADLANPDRVVALTEEKTIESCMAFVRAYHLLVGGSTGTVLAAVQQLSPEFARGDTIVAISPDLGEKYLDTVYDPAWAANVIAPEAKKPPRTSKEKTNRDSRSDILPRSGFGG
jgi:N-(2-amino-2-carboxyethyl)-L-glutamate synthase